MVTEIPLAVKRDEKKGKIWSHLRSKWLRGRSLFFDDPEGNTLELIAYHPGEV